MSILIILIYVSIICKTIHVRFNTTCILNNFRILPSKRVSSYNYVMILIIPVMLDYVAIQLFIIRDLHLISNDSKILILVNHKSYLHILSKQIKFYI